MSRRIGRQHLAMLAGLLLVATAFGSAFAGCGSARRGEPIVGPLHLSDADPADENELRGQQVFMANCYQCHPGGRAGVGPALNDKPLPGFAIRTQVRQGFGEMPAFSEESISDDDLDALVAYIVALRRAEPSSSGQ